ncbi:MAG: hypothetical protein NTW86_15430 [Candidatus Sumerlaeota bacterium]|nr:hypothetical protein [Candidatus Sumerlaeota bacterium]
MNHAQRSAARPFLIVAMLLLAGLSLSSCASAKLRLTPLPSAEAAGLSPDDTVAILKQAGFNDAEILQVGAEVRNSLARDGGVKVQLKHSTEAILAVDSQYIQVASRRTGAFIYDTKTHKFQ